MPRAFATITFTESVKAAQLEHGSRGSYATLEQSEDARAALGPREIEFVSERDSFYMATVSETGWPYVQHRGGPPGFLKALDARTLAFADFSGNRQYLSVGNLATNDRVCLFLMDYAQQRRLKVWGRARLVAEHAEPALAAAVEDASYRARVERVMVIHVEAWDWNCPKHITPRFSAAELEQRLAALQDELAACRAALQAATPSQPASTPQPPRVQP